MKINKNKTKINTKNLFFNLSYQTEELQLLGVVVWAGITWSLKTANNIKSLQKSFGYEEVKRYGSLNVRLNPDQYGL